LAFSLGISRTAWAQTDSAAPAAGQEAPAAGQETPAAPQKAPAAPDSAITNPGVPTRVAPVQDNRIFGVLPNYRTADGTKVFVPLTTQQKFHIAVKDSFDWPGFILAAVFSGFYQLDDQNPSFGQGIKGYAHRYVTSYADQVAGNMMTEAILPSLLHEDPRYFRRVTGTKKQRVLYALSRIVVTRTDSGGTSFNTSEVLGNGIAAALGNAYYPDDRGAGDTFERMATAIGTDAISDVLKEFWPDLKRHFFPKRAARDGM
jgi:hypothetical protein